MLKHVMALSALFLMAACAPAVHQGNAEDPLEPLNRQVFAFNEVVDRFVLKPVAQGYRYIVPEFGRKAVRNAVRNYWEPLTMTNSLLQLDDERFFTAMWRFILNTTFGFLGTYDFAGEYAGLPHRSEDFGQTLGVWSNNADSAYLVLPILGPSTTRDAFGRLVDIALDPFTYALKAEELIAIAATDGLATREALLDPLDEIYRTSFDPYVTIRSAYKQRRSAQILNRNAGRSALSVGR